MLIRANCEYVVLMQARIHGSMPHITAPKLVVVAALGHENIT